MDFPLSALTPTILDGMDLIGDLPDSDTPLGTYRIWTVPCCDLTSRAAEGLRELGCLVVHWRDADDGAGCLTVRQRLLLEESNAYQGCLTSTLTARCAPDEMGSMQTWDLTTSLVAPDGRDSAPPWTEHGVVEGAHIRFIRGEHHEEIPCTGPVLADASLLIRRQCLLAKHLDVLDLDGVFHRNQTWRVAEDPVPGVAGSGPLRRAARWGGGAHPWNLWYDGAGRAVVAVNNALALILDAQAEQRCSERAEQAIYWSRVRPEDVA